MSKDTRPGYFITLLCNDGETPDELAKIILKMATLSDVTLTLTRGPGQVRINGAFEDIRTVIKAAPSEHDVFTNVAGNILPGIRSWRVAEFTDRVTVVGSRKEDRVEAN